MPVQGSLARYQHLAPVDEEEGCSQQKQQLVQKHIPCLAVGASLGLGLSQKGDQGRTSKRLEDSIKYLVFILSVVGRREKGFNRGVT